MRVALAAAVFATFALLPHVLRANLLERGSPRMLAWSGATSLLGIAAGFVAVLAAVVSPGPLPLADLPAAIEICALATGHLLSHPLRHWPSILAALVLLAAGLRVIAAAVLITRTGRRARPPRERFPGEELAIQTYLGVVPPCVRLVPFDGAVAFTTGLARRVIVVSEGLMRALGPEERSAVLAHERAHARRGHTAILLGARIIHRAFGFVPGVGASVALLVTGLEARADDEASIAVADRLVVATALATTARLSTQRTSLAAAGVADGEISYRIKHLTAPDRPRNSARLVAVLTIVTLAMLVAQTVAWSWGQRALTRERLAWALHATCHDPHDAAS